MINTPKEAEGFFHKYASEFCGSLCVFGDWFGRPYDNCHRIVSFEVNGGNLKLNFNEGETLEVREWGGLAHDGKGFIIQHANYVRWEWFYYGRPKLPENRFFVEHVVKDGNITANSNVNWYSPVFKPSFLNPAVALK